MFYVSCLFTCASDLTFWFLFLRLFFMAEIFWDDLKHARRIYQKRAILEDDSQAPVIARRLQGPAVVTNAVQNVKEIISPNSRRRLSNENEGAIEKEAGAVAKLDSNTSTN